MSQNTDLDQAEEDAGKSQLGGVVYREYWGRGQEQAHNRRVFGQTYREKYGQDIDQDVLFCIHDSHQGTTFPSAMHGKIRVLPASETPAFDPEPGRGDRLARWFGRCLGEFWLGLTYPFRASQDHTRAMIRDVLHDALIASALTIETVPCPVCEAGEDGELAIPAPREAAE